MESISVRIKFFGISTVVIRSLLQVSSTLSSNENMITLLGLFFIILGASVSLIGLYDFYKVMCAKSWEQTTGVVKKASVTEIKSGATSSYIPELIYEYTVDNVAFSSDRIFFGFVSNLSEFEANQCVTKHSIGSKLTVYFNKSYPEMSVLSVISIKPSVLKLWVGILPLVIGVFLVASFSPKYAFWFFLLWFIPVIWLLENGKQNPFNQIK